MVGSIPTLMMAFDVCAGSNPVPTTVLSMTLRYNTAMKDIVKSLATRYEAKLDNSQSSDRLRSMLIAMVENVSIWPIDKTNRWIGFIQGVLWERELIDIDEEREFTRPLFHSYYESYGIEKPTSVDAVKIKEA